MKKVGSLEFERAGCVGANEQERERERAGERKREREKEREKEGAE